MIDINRGILNMGKSLQAVIFRYICLDKTAMAIENIMYL